MRNHPPSGTRARGLIAGGIFSADIRRHLLSELKREAARIGAAEESAG